MSRIAEDLDPGPYNGLPGFKTGGTSRDAAVAAAGDAALLRERVFAAIKNSSGLTADEAAAAVNRSVLSVRPRVTELAAHKRIVPTGERRKNLSGCGAKVWRAR